MGRLYAIRKKASEYIKANKMIEHGDIIVVGVSGGADSMCLLNILMDIKEEYCIKLVAVHVHHGIRGKEAECDMEYVESFCVEHNIDYRGIRYDIPQIAKKEHWSPEEAGRIKRYEAFNIVLKEEGGKGKIAVAHNMNDNSETFLLNLFRGTGLLGLAGIQPVRDNIIRPILCLEREEILTYLREKNVEYRTDSTNEETDYTRNKIRLRLMPYVRKNINEKAMENINRAAVMLSDVSSYMELQCDKAAEKYIECQKGTYIIKDELWQEEQVIVRMVVRRAVLKAAEKLKDITWAHIDGIAGLGNNTVAKSVNIPYGIRAVRTYDGVRLEKNKPCNNGSRECVPGINFDLDDILDDTDNHNMKFIFTTEKNKSIDLKEKLYTKWMDYDILKGNLSIRSRKPGDYMVIGSDGQRKKLKDILIDTKVPREDRDKLVLLAKDSEILWIAGGRMSERCKITDKTEKIVRVDYRETTVSDMESEG